MDRKKIRIIQTVIDYLGAGLEGELGGGISRCQRKRHRPSRLRLLVVIVKLAAIVSTFVASCSFLSTVPAKPLPDCTSSSTFFSTTLEDSMFFMEAVSLVLLVASTPPKLLAKRLICSEK